MTAHAGVSVFILALLACNTVYYVMAGRASEALDSVAWYALLILFMLESARVVRAGSPRLLQVVRGLRLAAAVAVGAAAVGYVVEREWLDAVNIILWIAVVILLEAEVRYPASVARRRAAFTAAAALFYSGLAVLVAVWLARGEWMDAWDAALWLAAFGILELDLLHGAAPNKKLFKIKYL